MRGHFFDEPGIAAVRNFAWASVTSEWVAFIDSDCEVRQDWVEQATQRLPLLPESVASLGGVNLYPETLEYRSLKLALSSYLGGHNSPLNQEFCQEHSVGHLPTLNLCIRRQVLTEIGGFDNDFHMSGEDLDLSRRIGERGYELWASPNLVITHHTSPLWTDWAHKMYNYGLGRLQYMEKHGYQAIFLAPGLIAGFYISVLGLSLLDWRFLVLVVASLLLHFAISFFALPNKGGRGAAALRICMIHIVYGCGIIARLLRKTPRAEKEALYG